MDEIPDVFLQGTDLCMKWRLYDVVKDIKKEVSKSNFISPVEEQQAILYRDTGSFNYRRGQSQWTSAHKTFLPYVSSQPFPPTKTFPLHVPTSHHNPSIHPQSNKASKHVSSLNHNTMNLQQPIISFHSRSASKDFSYHPLVSPRILDPNSVRYLCRYAAFT